MVHLPFPYGRAAVVLGVVGLLASKAAAEAPDAWFTPLLQGGSAAAVLGAMCYFLAVRMERKMDESVKAQKEIADEFARAQMEMARALNHASKSNLLVVLALRSLDGNLAEMAKVAADEIDTR